MVNAVTVGHYNCQYFGGLDFRRKSGVPYLLTGANRIQRAHDHLTSPRTVRVFRKAVLKQLSVGQNDPELIVQEVKEFCQVTVGNSCLRVQAGHGGVQAVLRRFWSSFEAARSALASRHNVSVKIRTEPPAVLMYSTFPLEIQL